MLGANVSEQHIGPIFKGQEVQEQCYLPTFRNNLSDPSSKKKQSKNNVIFRRFGKTYLSHLQDSSTLKRTSFWTARPLTIGPIDCTKTSGNNYHSKPHTIP